MPAEIIKGLKVKVSEAEKTRKYLYMNKLLREDYKIKREKEYIYFPIKNQLSENKEINSFITINKEFEKKRVIPKSYKDLIEIPSSLKNILPTSYDVIGDIILIKLPKELVDYQKNIGEALLSTHKNVKTVCLSKPVSGELRTRNIKIIAGEKNTKTIHKEYGLEFFVDVNKTYFSPRLANERKRIANLVKPGETVVDMFAGVAPFSIMIAKYANPKIVYAIDKNKDAVNYAKQNINHNKVLDRVEIICEDAKNIEKILKKNNTKADRIIMNLPFSAYTFFPFALNNICTICTIHYYDIIKEERIKELLVKLKEKAKEKNINLIDITYNKIKTYAPREFYIGIDITAKKII